jgi:hypothetical protein
VFTDWILYVYNFDAAGFPLVKSKSIPTSSGTRGAVACADNSTLYVSFGGDGGSKGNGGLLAYDLLGDAVLWTQNSPTIVPSFICRLASWRTRVLGKWWTQKRVMRSVRL